MNYVKIAKKSAIFHMSYTLSSLTIYSRFAPITENANEVAGR